MLAHAFSVLMKLPLAKPREICFSSVICPLSSWPISLKKKKNEVVVWRVLRTQEGACHRCPSKGYADKAGFREAHGLSWAPFAILSSFFTLPFRNPLPLWYVLAASLFLSVPASLQGCVILLCLHNPSSPKSIPVYGMTDLYVLFYHRTIQVNLKLVFFRVTWFNRLLLF